MMNSLAIVVLIYVSILHTESKPASLISGWILSLFALCLAELIYNFYILLDDKGFAWSSYDLNDGKTKHKYAINCDFQNLQNIENGCSSVKREETYACAQKCATSSECSAYISIGKNDAPMKWCCLRKGEVYTNMAVTHNDTINGNPSICGVITRML